jgi:hypothetical protein
MSWFDQDRPVFENFVLVKIFNLPYFKERPGIFKRILSLKVKNVLVFWKRIEMSWFSVKTICELCQKIKKQHHI